MAGITIEIAEEQLAIWLMASTAVSNGQKYSIDTGNGSRSLERVDAEEIENQIDCWQAKVNALTPASQGGRRGIRYVVPE